MKWTLAIAAGCLLTGLVFGYCVHPEPDPPPRSAPERIVIEKPVPVPTFTERIVYRPVEVEVTRTVTEVDTLVVREFLEAAADSTSEPIHLPYSIEFDGKALLMWGTMSDGSRTYNEYDIRPKFRAGWDADSTWAREERLARFPKWKVAGGTAIVAGVIVCLLVCK